MPAGFKNSRKLWTNGQDPNIPVRLLNLENNEYKITYYEIISGASGSLTLPTGATINAGEFGLSGNCILSKIDGSNKPTFESPRTSGGTVVTASLNVSTGAWVASGTYTDSDVALIYSIKIKAVNYGNLDYNFIIETIEIDTGVQSVTGSNVDNTDPLNPVINTPTLQEVTDEGYTTTNPLIIDDGLGNGVVDIGQTYLNVLDSTAATPLLEVDRVNDTVKVLGSDVEIQSNKQNSLAVDGTGTKYPTVDAVNAGFEKGLKILHSDFTVSATLTGTTAITLINSALIPANSVNVGDALEILTRAQRDTLTGTAVSYIYINTSNTLAGATLIGFASNAGGWYALQRVLNVRSATESETIGNISSSNSDYNGGGASTSPTILNIDWTVNQYIIQAFANAAVGNNTTSRGLIINRFRK